jgi:hypothetical protein
MEGLFQLDTSLSPRLAWMAEHDITTQQVCRKGAPAYLAWSTEMCADFINEREGELEGIRRIDRYHDELVGAKLICFGATENDALHALAVANGLRLWNEAT